MSQDRELAALLPAGLDLVLEALDRVTAMADDSDRDTLAFNILVNALATVLERLRAEDPEEHRVHLAMAQALLRDG
ncbi:hypothetical protein [Rubellimicrobium roseum]|uniref:Uncharacterized protein n=1 Tax=Rubellimicrobium roseum TaxID=687525 RepID=A0A5C4NAZ6_9RHOB|nr:hypothetical protein [Rubellimicrobium roseum]TNC70893.1 hypothetical protein FHG71_12900 [Rubellimicrobium roseum]